MILKVRRISLHPWVWWVVVRNAVVALQNRDTLSPEGRRRISALLRTIDASLDPDDSVIENPYLRLSRHELEARKRRNAEIVAELNGDEYEAKFVQQTVDDRGRVHAAWLPLPAPDLRVSIDVPDGEVKMLENALHEHAGRAELKHDLDHAFVDALDAIAAGKHVSVDTAAAGPDGA